MYNDDRFCSLVYTTDFLKDGCLASIGSSYDKNAKMGTSVLILKILYMCSCKGPVNHIIHIFWWKDSVDPPAVAPAISAITNISTVKGGGFYNGNVDH